MKKSAILMVILLLLISGINASAATTVSQNFGDFETASDVVPGRLFSMYTNKTPELEMHNGYKCLKIDSESNADNILLMTPQNFKKGGFSVSFQMTADSAPKANWGRAPHIIIRYKSKDNKWVNDTIAEFAYDLIRVKVDGIEKKVLGFNANSFYDFEFNFIKEENKYKLTYIIEEQAYTKEYETADDTEICVGFFSYLGNALYLKNIDYSETYSMGLTDSEIENIIKNRNLSRPRILMNSDRLNKITTLVNTDARFKEWYANVKKEADSALKAPVSNYELRDGERLLYVSRDVYKNTVYPAFVYLIEGGDKYKNRIWAELFAAGKFKDWHPEHFLDTAEMTFAFAICYDWLYDSWSESQRLYIKNAIKELGLDAAMKAYDGNAEYDKNAYGAYHNRIGWKNDASNWGIVCNGGIALGAMAIIDNENADYCADILEDAMRGLETPISAYAPDGAWIEGVGYWHYAMQYLSYTMSSMKNTLGSTYEYMEGDGIKNAAKYFVAHTGPQGVFNYGDCADAVFSAPELFYLADFYNDGAINSERLAMMKKFDIEGSLDDILFYNPDVLPRVENIEKSSVFNSVGVATSCSSHESNMASYIAMKAGDIGVSHGDLDAGTFIIDALGVRWVTDYGNDSYTLPGYFDWSSRINYYRKRAEGHSTLVINPDSGADQKVGTTAPITEFISGDGGMFCVTDMSDVYSNDAKSVKRAVAMYDDSSRFMVQDEVITDTPSEVCWFVQTNQTATLGQDAKTVTLSSGNKRMLMVLQSNSSEARFYVTSAKPLATSPNPVGQSSNNGYLRIGIVCEDVTDLILRVVFVPYVDGFMPDVSGLKPLERIDKMSVELNTEKYAKPDSVYVDGKPFDEFSKQLYYYSLNADGVMPVIEAESDKYDITVNYGNITEVIVSDPEGILEDGKYYFMISGTADDEIRAELDDGVAKVYTYNQSADIYIASFDKDGKLNEVKFFENAKNTVRADVSTSDVKVFVWDNFKPVRDAISLTN